MYKPSQAFKTLTSKLEKFFKLTYLIDYMYIGLMHEIFYFTPQGNYNSRREPMKLL